MQAKGAGTQEIGRTKAMHRKGDIVWGRLMAYANDRLQVWYGICTFKFWNNMYIHTTTHQRN